jgi:DNA-binding LacI/PurR family transcriptional regulator
VRFLGQLAASQVMALIEKPESAVSQMVVPTELVQRQSVLKIN